jgi:hypothetical protein
MAVRPKHVAVCSSFFLLRGARLRAHVEKETQLNQAISSLFVPTCVFYFCSNISVVITPVIVADLTKTRRKKKSGRLLDFLQTLREV